MRGVIQSEVVIECDETDWPQSGLTNFSGELIKRFVRLRGERGAATAHHPVSNGFLEGYGNQPSDRRTQLIDLIRIKGPKLSAKTRHFESAKNGFDVIYVEDSLGVCGV